MRIYISEIPLNGEKINADSRKDAWLKMALEEALGDRAVPSNYAILNIDITKVDDNVRFDGSVELHLNTSCDRCLEEYSLSEKVKIHHTLAPLYQSKRQKEHEEEKELELVKEDLDFAFYEGDAIELKDIVRENIMLTLPIKYLCSEDCKGLCSSCGKSLNGGPCNCKK